MNRRAGFVLTALGLLLCANVGWHLRQATQVTPLWVEASGYTELVNRALRNHLRFEIRHPTQVASPAPTPIQVPVSGKIHAVDRQQYGRVLVEDWGGGPSPAEQQFIARSFILEDLGRPDHFEERSDRTARLISSYRRRPLPYSDDVVWQGNVLFRESRRTPVVETQCGRILQLVPPPPTGVGPAVHVPFEPKDCRKADTTTLIGSQFVWRRDIEQAFRLFTVPGPDGISSVVLARPANAIGTLRHNGAPTEQQGSLRSFVPGDWLIYKDADGRYERLYHRTAESGVLSDWRRHREGYTRTLHETHGLEPVIEELTGTLDRAVTFGHEASRRARDPSSVGGVLGAIQPHEIQTRDVRLTMYGMLQEAAQNLLDTKVHGRMKPHGWTHTLRGTAYPHLPPRAAIAVADISNGDVLAAASYPQKHQLDDHVEALRLRPPGRLGPVLQHTLREVQRRSHAITRHQAFVPHQVGSTIKPLFGAAVALQWQGHGGDPLGLVVAGTGPLKGRPPALIRGVNLAYPMGSYLDHCTAGVPIDFRTFLASSCNAFMFKLGAVALESAGTDPRACRTQLGAHLASTLLGRPPTTTAQARGLHPVEAYAWLTGALTRNEGTTGVFRWGTDVWGPLEEDLQSLIGEELGCQRTRSTSLVGASPEVVNFDVSSLSTCAPHFSSFLKGGSTNRWSNIDFSVAYARLVTGRPVRPRLVVSDVPTPVAPVRRSDCDAFLGCGDPTRYARTRSAVLNGMAGALQPRGTAAGAVGSTVRQVLGWFEGTTGVRWGAYAKTGSSVRDISVVTGLQVTKKSTLEPIEEAVEVRIGNFVLVLLACDEPPPLQRSGFACARLPAPGEPMQGYVMHLWTEAVPDLTGGGWTATLLRTAEGKELLQRLSLVAGGQR